MASDIEYFTSGDNINPALVTSDAQRAAESFFSDPKKPIMASQLRKFYGDVKTLELRKKNGAAFEAILPLIKLLKAKSAYACKRNVVPQSFREWLWKNVDNINTERDFTAFLLHFEAVVGFCYGEAKGNFN